MTFPFRWLTSTSPSMLTNLDTLADTWPSSADISMRFFSRYSLAHSETSLLTQCQLLGLWRTILAGERRVSGVPNLESTQPDQLEVFPNHKLPKRMRYKSDREIYAPAKLFRSKKSTSLLGLVPANIYHPFSQPQEMYDEKTRILT